MLNVVALMGRLVATPELKHTQNGISVVTFTVACDRNFARQGEQRQTDFIDVTAWRQTADFVCKYFQKGSMIALDGSIQTRKYQDKNGNNRVAFEVVANNVSFTGSKASSGGNSPAPYSQNVAPAAPAAYAAPVPEAVPSYSAGANDDFAVIDDSEDLPF